MSAAAELITEAQDAGVSLYVIDGWIRVEPKSKLPDELEERIRAQRAEVVAELQREEWRARVWRELERRPHILRYLEVDAECDPVRVVLALRGVGTVDLLIDRDRWDVEKFLSLVAAPTSPEH